MSNQTHRVYFDYVTGSAAGVSKEHTVMLRIVANQTDVETAIQIGQDIMGDVLQMIGPSSFRSGWRIIRGRVAAAGSDFSLPFDLSGVVETFNGTSTTSGWTGAQEAIQYTWVGRSTTSGKRVRLSLYGIGLITIDSNFRLTPSENPQLAANVPDVLNLQAAIVALDNTTVQWYRYCNVQYNSYWERRIRRG